ncbi:hypothetical protein ACFLT7_08395, partial [candidate division KSB1 bacterium]
ALGRSTRSGDGLWYDFPPTPESGEIVSRKARDILMLNWSHGFGAEADSELTAFGFEQIYGNFDGLDFQNWRERSAPASILGAQVSTWSGADEYSFGKRGLLARMLTSINFLWSVYDPPEAELTRQVALMQPRLRRQLSATRQPSLENRSIFRSIQLKDHLNVSAADFDPDSGFLLISGGEYHLPNLQFNLFPATEKRNFALMLSRPGEPMARYPDSLGPVPINGKAAGLIFLHGLTGLVEPRRPSVRDPGADSELIGFYRINYEDGSGTDCPIRAGENIAYAPPNRMPFPYFSRPVPVGTSGRFFCLYAYEWVNPRVDVAIRDFSIKTLPGPSLVRPVLIAVTAVALPEWNVGF